MTDKDDLKEEAIAVTADVEMPDPETISDSEAEEFARKLIARAATLNGVKINRDKFLRTELKKHCPHVDAEFAIKTTPIQAGASAKDVDKIARSVINFETKKCAGISFLAGIPGGAALAATVPADLTQYFAHVMRIEQKLAYLYGWQSFLNNEDEVDDETVMQLILLMGVMLGVGSAAGAINKFAATIAKEGVTKTIQRQALTKYAFYPVLKNVLKIVGIKMTKETFAKAAGKVVPVLGGALSGGLTYATFKPSAEHLRTYLRALPISGINPDEPDDYEENDVISKAGATVSATANGAVNFAKSKAPAINDAAQQAGAAVASTAQKAGEAAADAAKSASAAAQEALGSVSSFLGSIGKNKKKE